MMNIFTITWNWVTFCGQRVRNLFLRNRGTYFLSGDDILTILTKVNEEVSRKEGVEKVNETTCDAKMTPEPRFTFTKKLIFRIP
ncbi:hypothetical protein MHYP_G00233280 [Metynnis hypsauchen]